jgi:hypothetical protein
MELPEFKIYQCQEQEMSLKDEMVVDSNLLQIFNQKNTRRYRLRVISKKLKTARPS